MSTRSRSPTPRSATRSPVRMRSVSPRQSPIGDRPRNTSLSRSRSPASRDRSRSRSTQPSSAKVVVEKLTKNINKEHLREIFGSYGPLENIEMPMNHTFMTNRGVAFILYREVEDAEAAIANLHEAQIDGANIDVSIVLPSRSFSRSPPPSRRLSARMDRFSGPARAYRGQSGPRGRFRSPPHRWGSPPRGYGRGGRAGSPDYRRRSYSRSRSPPPRRRSYSRSYSRSPSRSPPPRRDYRSRESPPPAGGRRGRSRSYDSYDSRDRSLSRERGGGGYSRR